MRDFLLANGPVLAGILAALELLFGVLLLALFGRRKKPVLLYMALVSLALCYDAAVLALGALLPENVLRPLSQLRFVFHGLFIPLLLPICAEALRWSKKAKTAVWIVTAVLMACGAVSGVLTKLEPSSVAGITRFLSGEGTPALAECFTRVLSYGTVVPLIAAGIAVWIKRKNAALFLAGFLMFAFSALGPATGNFDLIFLIGMFGEVFMVLFFLIFGKTDR
ncbi:MAG: hypothetical protein II458_05600 [Oscillospiraceae bacterium]|nr:hypothetical protein [Oscillospiraceae bacterium]